MSEDELLPLQKSGYLPNGMGNMQHLSQIPTTASMSPSQVEAYEMGSNRNPDKDSRIERERLSSASSSSSLLRLNIGGRKVILTHSVVGFIFLIAFG